MYLAELCITRSVSNTCSHTALRQNVRALYDTRHVFRRKVTPTKTFCRGPGYLHFLQRRYRVAHSFLSTLAIIYFQYVHVGFQNPGGTGNETLERLCTTKIRKIRIVWVRVTKVAAKICPNATETEQIYENIFRYLEY